MKRHGEKARERKKTVGRPRDLRRKPLHLTADEIEQLRRPEIPLEQWRKGEALLGSKRERLTILQAGRKIADSQGRKNILADKARLRQLIANDPRRVKDFQFFTKKLAWEPEGFLQDLYWDCNMMHATLQTILASERRKIWRMDSETLERILRHLVALAKETKALNRTDFSPGRTVILRNRQGQRLSRADEKYLLRVFGELPKILCLFARELRRKLRLWEAHWQQNQAAWKELVEGVRENSLYEKIRAKAGQYHSARLHRLVNAAREVQALPRIEYRAFVVWLNRLRKRRRQPWLQPAR